MLQPNPWTGLGRGGGAAAALQIPELMVQGTGLVRWAQNCCFSASMRGLGFGVLLGGLPVWSSSASDCIVCLYAVLWGGGEIHSSHKPCLAALAFGVVAGVWCTPTCDEGVAGRDNTTLFTWPLTGAYVHIDTTTVPGGVTPRKSSAMVCRSRRSQVECRGLFEVPDTVALSGIWDHYVGN